MVCKNIDKEVGRGEVKASSHQPYQVDEQHSMF